MPIARVLAISAPYRIFRGKTSTEPVLWAGSGPNWLRLSTNLFLKVRPLTFSAGDKFAGVLTEGVFVRGSRLWSSGLTDFSPVRSGASPSGGPNKSVAKRQHITGWEDGRPQKAGPASADPMFRGFPICRYAAFAFLAAVAWGCFGFAFSVAFRAACAFCLAANSCWTLAVIAATSTL